MAGPRAGHPITARPRGEKLSAGEGKKSHGLADARPLGGRLKPGHGEEVGRFRDGVLEILSGVPDPEIPCVSVVDLGIVREVREGVPPTLVITPTYTGCPATVAIEAGIRTALNDAGYARMKIETTLSPPWTTDWISDEGREKLRAYGIAPPPKGSGRRTLRERKAQCPRCHSQKTEEISRFGSTPCKALHRCLSCGEPFDLFKCH